MTHPKPNPPIQAWCEVPLDECLKMWGHEMNTTHLGPHGPPFDLSFNDFGTCEKWRGLPPRAFMMKALVEDPFDGERHWMWIYWRRYSCTTEKSGWGGVARYVAMTESEQALHIAKRKQRERYRQEDFQR